MTYHGVFNKSNRTSATSGAGTVYSYGTHVFFHGIEWGYVLLDSLVSG